MSRCQQLARADFVDEVVEVLAATGMPANRLVLEITESVLLGDVEGTIVTLTALRERGIRVAIDDFGTGYSSLSYLSQLPVDVLKVDKSFVDKVSGNGADTSLVEAIIAMSRTMRLKTVAEGVEHPEQAAWLQLAHCTMGQGYLWSRPVALEAAHALLTLGPRLLSEPPRIEQILPRSTAVATTGVLASGHDDTGEDLLQTG